MNIQMNQKKNHQKGAKNMFEIIVLDLKNKKKFTKHFSSEFLKNEFKKSCKHSKNIKILAEFKN